MQTHNLIAKTPEKKICPVCHGEIESNRGYRNAFGPTVFCGAACAEESLKREGEQRIAPKHDPFHDPVKKPRHYTQHKSGVECIKITEQMNFCLGNAMKYIWRADLKNGSEDLKKAIWYLEREITRRVLTGENK